MTAHARSFAGPDAHDMAPAAASARPSARSAADPSAGLYRRGAKRLCDVLFVLLLAPVAVPVVLVMAAIVASDGTNPFYSQVRIGRGGGRFRMWKIRTMVADADAALAACLAADPEMRAEWARHQKLRHDPRITRIGRLLRKTSLDELPQFLNVLTGDMSVIGPRPMMDGQDALYPGRAYYALRPGVTGPWQVSDRHATSFADRARFDDEYEDGLSLATDARLVLRTIGVVLRGTGC